MLLSANLDNNLWAAAVNTANYLRNLSPSSCLKGKSPFEALHKRLPKLSNLRIFGCEPFPLNFNKIDKFDPVAKDNCILIGYGEKEGIYWLLDKNTNKAFRSRDVKFNEELNLSEAENMLEIQNEVNENLEDQLEENELEKEENETKEIQIKDEKFLVNLKI